jgi:5-methyltetrahydrofolate--homocysteine methyltransferase
MKINFKNNWDDTIRRFDAWYAHKPLDRPLMNVWVENEPNEMPYGEHHIEPFADAEESFLNTDKQFLHTLNWLRRIRPMAEAYPHFTMFLGAGSMALYLGCKPVFTPETLWFEPFVESYDGFLPIEYNPNAEWWVKHLNMVKRQVELCKETDIAVCIPDIVENIDILSALRDPQVCCYDLYDHPNEVKQALADITRLHKVYYDQMYDIVKNPANGTSAYTAFNIIGTGKTAKLQCDFNAFMSPEHFNEFVIPTLVEQCSWLDNTIFHLDGPECIVHVDALMSIERLGALQWTTGAKNPRSGDERWFPMYKKVMDAGKGLWIELREYSVDESITVADTLVRTFGKHGFYFNFPNMTKQKYDTLMEMAENKWAGC